MALHRLKARMRFTASSGMATWCKNQMSVRYGQAVHINEGLANEEQKQNEVIKDGDYENFFCDLPLSSSAYASDAYNTLSDANVLGSAVVFPNGMGDGEPSWVEYLICHHDEEPVKPCEIVNKKYNS